MQADNRQPKGARSAFRLTMYDLADGRRSPAEELEDR